MTQHAWSLFGLYLVVLLLAVKPLGDYIAHVVEGRSRVCGAIERPLYRLCGIRPDEEMGWVAYTLAILLFNVLGVLAVYGLQRVQAWLPLNPQAMANVSPDSAFNTALSFVTNTNWQGYGGESTMSYLTQMLALAVQNFLSAATGIAVVIALIRGFARHAARTVGNAWVDLTRITLFVLLPLCVVYAVFLVGQGVIQNFEAYQDVTTLQGPTQTLAMGPVASQEAITLLTQLGVDPSASNMEGKETRFGIADSGLFATITTLASCGAGNAMHDSFTPLGGMIPLVDMQLGEVVFGGVGSGLYGMLVFAILAVFIAGLMIGRTPEYLGKKIEAYEMKMTSIAILVTPLVVLAGTAIAVMVDAGKAGVANPGAHGFSEILYAFTSAANNNGSAFAGLSANTPFYNTMLGLAVWLGRFGVIVPVLAMAGSLAAKKRIAPGAGTMPTHGPLFVVLLIGAVLLVGLLNYVPALALGPVIEHLVLWAGH